MMADCGTPMEMAFAANTSASVLPTNCSRPGLSLCILPDPEQTKYGAQPSSHSCAAWAPTRMSRPPRTIIASAFFKRVVQMHVFPDSLNGVVFGHIIFCSDSIPVKVIVLIPSDAATSVLFGSSSVKSSVVGSVTSSFFIAYW